MIAVYWIRRHLILEWHFSWKLRSLYSLNIRLPFVILIGFDFLFLLIEYFSLMARKNVQRMTGFVVKFPNEICRRL